MLRTSEGINGENVSLILVPPVSSVILAGYTNALELSFFICK